MSFQLGDDGRIYLKDYSHVLENGRWIPCTPAGETSMPTQPSVNFPGFAFVSVEEFAAAMQAETGVDITQIKPHVTPGINWLPSGKPTIPFIDLDPSVRAAKDPWNKAFVASWDRVMGRKG